MDHSLPLEEIIYFQIERCHKAMRKYTQKKLNHAGFDITIDQFVILKMLIESDGLSQSAIASATLKDNASVTRIIEQLLKKGYVKKFQGADKRTSDYELTQTGEKYLSQVMPLIFEVRETGVKEVSEKDLSTTINSLKRIAESFG